MTATPAELLRAMDAKATNGPWRRAAPNEYPWRIGPNDYRGEDTFTIIADGDRDRGYGVLSVPVSLTDGPHEGNAALFVTLRNSLPLLAAYTEAADALRALDIAPLYGAHAAWAKTGDDRAAKLLDERDERIHVCVQAYDAARDALVRAMQEGQ